MGDPRLRGFSNFADASESIPTSSNSTFNRGDAPACRRRHYARSGKGYRRGRAMADRTEEIRSTRAPKLREDQIEVLGRYGRAKETEAGEVLFRAGDASNDFVVVLEGGGGASGER